jgi:hypothetical protein
LFFCTSPTPATPVLLQEWNAVDGIEGVDGTIEVTTAPTNDPAVFRHTVVLKKVTFKRGNSDFFLGNEFLFGSFETSL